MSGILDFIEDGDDEQAMPGRSCYLTPAEMNALFAPGVSAQDVQTYLYLRWHRNRSTGVAFPGRAKLAAATGTTARSVTTRVERLEAVGMITVERDQGRANVYRFPYASSEVDFTGSSEADFTGDAPSSEVDFTGVVKLNAPSSEVDFPLTVLNSSKKKTLSEEFDEWYALYPRKEAKGAALKAFKAARKKVDAGTLMTGVREYVDHMKRERTERKFIPYPATWLNREQWTDALDAASAPAAYVDPGDWGA